MIGWYCTLNASLAQDAINGGQCLAGSYCPIGSGAPVACTTGQFCQTAGLHTPTGDCTQGRRLLCRHSSPVLLTLYILSINTKSYIFEFESISTIDGCIIIYISVAIELRTSNFELILILNNYKISNSDSN